VGLLGACSTTSPSTSPTGTDARGAAVGGTTTGTGPPGFVVAVAGDVVCSPAEGGGVARPPAPGPDDECRDADTAELIDDMDPDAVLVPGDLQYPAGAMVDIEGAYDKTWGEFKEKTYPAIGNHDIHNAATGYYPYWGERAGTPGQGWYSVDLGGWHVISLNSNCGIQSDITVPCVPGSPQFQWLESDLLESEATCTVAFWHHPRFSSGEVHGSDPAVAAFFQALYDADADVVVTGHEHNYERFAPLDADGQVDQQGGIRSFVVGSGGKSHYGFAEPVTGSEVRNSTDYGVLRLELRDTSYDWKFVSTGGEELDSGRGECH
jgi:3',5'-cyclic AMP phosphodiesterase CpdA